ncbi:hypothetical protein C8R45DRAFT_1020519 [Mycena sanguinolenta]|nr:hypothetical protein C8R45DRAFT_1020519 [Mycena sanguinolenta]
MTIELPQELVDTILDCLEGDLASLKACSLVSRGWVARSRSYLFESLSIQPENILVFRDLLRSPCSTFTPHVHNLSAKRQHEHQNDPCFNGIAPDLRLLENVRTLKMWLGVVVDSDRSKEDAFFRTGFPTAFPNVTHLVLTCYFASYQSSARPVPLIEMICLFPALRSLHIEKISGSVADPPASAVPPRGLHCLNLGFDSPSTILAWLHSFNHLPSVDSLILLPTVRNSQLSVVRRALQQLGGALHHLEISLIRARIKWFYDIDLLALFDPTPHPNLRTLIIRDVRGRLDLAELISLLTVLASPSLERLSLVADLSLAMDTNLDWTTFDGLLSPARFPRLRDVTLMHEPEHSEEGAIANVDDTAAFLRTSLPSLAGSGVLGLDLG